MTIDMIDMYDSIINSKLPPDARAYAAYVDGDLEDQPNYGAVTSMFPGAQVLSIALHPSHDADCLDMESGAASPSNFSAWWIRQRSRGIERPAAYMSVGNMASELLPMLAGWGIPLTRVRLWSAHYGAGEHICAPSTCRRLPVTADGTQWLGGSEVDRSLLLDNFFSTDAPPAPIPTWQENIMQALPQLQQGATGSMVDTVQGLCIGRGIDVAVDGNFGPQTDTAVRALQAAGHITVDGIVGPQTWAALLGIAS
jgi:hypothetical protein